MRGNFTKNKIKKEGVLESPDWLEAVAALLFSAVAQSELQLRQHWQRFRFGGFTILFLDV